MNSCNFTGRLTADVELKSTANGVQVASFTLAVKRPRVKDKTDFLYFQAWEQAAVYLSTYAKKGDLIAVTGVLTSRDWEDKNQNKRTSFEVVCNTVEIVNSSGNKQGVQTPTANANAENNPYTGATQLEEYTDEDLPF